MTGTAPPPAETAPAPIALALGSNQGDRIAALRDAVDRLKPFMTIAACSPVYEAAATGVAGEPPFLNAVITANTRLSPLALLWTVKDIENGMGRAPTYRYGPRLIDIDILYYADRVQTTAELTLPHPRLVERVFVLRPLFDIAPGWVHPTTGRSVANMLAAMPHGDLAPAGRLA